MLKCRERFSFSKTYIIFWYLNNSKKVNNFPGQKIKIIYFFFVNNYIFIQKLFFFNLQIKNLNG